MRSVEIVGAASESCERRLPRRARVTLLFCTAIEVSPASLIGLAVQARLVPAPGVDLFGLFQSFQYGKRIARLYI